jgi:hypothetical protein
MSTETGGPGDTPEDEYVDIDEELEPDSEKQGFLSRTRQKLGNAKDKYVGWHTVDQPKQDKGVAGTNISRRGFVAGAAQVGVAGYAVAEATDGDGWDVDLNSNGAGAPEGGGVSPPPGEEGNQTDTGDQAAGGIENGQEYAFETEQELIESTGICYPGESDAYIGAIDASEVEDTLEETGYNGNDPSGALNAEEVDMSLDDITANQGLYAVDVDRKQGNDGDYDMFVQLVGEEDGGLYVTREGAQQVSDMEFEEAFEGYHECS